MKCGGCEAWVLRRCGFCGSMGSVEVWFLWKCSFSEKYRLFSHTTENARV
jgi:hypothetical protein